MTDAQSELAALREELTKAGAAAELDAIGIQFEQQRVQTLQRKLTATEQRNADDARDAARYRWLRNPEQRDCVPPELDVICGVAEGEDVLWFEQLDRVIDAALKLTKPTVTGPKLCIECGQPYCLGVCVERGDDHLEFGASHDQ